MEAEAKNFKFNINSGHIWRIISEKHSKNNENGKLHQVAKGWRTFGDSPFSLKILLISRGNGNRTACSVYSLPSATDVKKSPWWSLPSERPARAPPPESRKQTLSSESWTAGSCWCCLPANNAFFTLWKQPSCTSVSEAFNVLERQKKEGLQQAANSLSCVLLRKKKKQVYDEHTQGYFSFVFVLFLSFLIQSLSTFISWILGY